jgi:type IV pilus assembly protein PilO
MARSDLVANLSRKPLPVKLGILAGVLAVLGFLYWQFGYSALVDERKQLENQAKKLAEENKRLSQREKDWAELLQKKEILDQTLKTNQVTLPASSELPAFYGHLQKQAAAAGVTIKKWSRRKESEVETYVKVPVAVELTGTFYQINNYFRLLAQTDRIITVENLWLGAGRFRNDEVILSAKFAAATFRQKDRPPDTTIVEEEPAPAADAKSGKPPAGKGARPAGEAGADGAAPPAAAAAPGAGTPPPGDQGGAGATDPGAGGTIP